MKSNNILPIPPYKDYFIGNAWYTRYNTDGSFEYHQHGHTQTIINGQMANTVFSIIYILNDQNVGNSTMFVNHDRNYLAISSDIDIDTADYSDIKEGTVIIFPSSFHHKVNRIKIPNRITVSYNIFGVL
jgi:predicted 2-oxoglutarate/Fe(II)-dependent dioxygenase YbiX